MIKFFKLFKQKLAAKRAAKKKEKESSCEILTEMERLFDKYNDNIIFKVYMGEDNQYLEIYSKNYKIGLETAKKRRKPKEDKEEDKENDN